MVIVLSFIAEDCKKNRGNNGPYGWTANRLIAHAGGGIAGKVYTNSLEAFEASYRNGHRLFEVDLSITADGRLVARHGWQDPYGQPFNAGEGPMGYKQFMESRYYGEYTPLDFTGVLQLLKEYEDVFLILDGKVSSAADTERLYEKVGAALEKSGSKVMNRLIPQMFYKKDIKILRQLGFQDIVYVVGREAYSFESIATFCSEHGIRVVSLSANRTEEEFVKELAKNDIEVYMYTFNDVEKMKPYLEMGARGFFTDFLMPSDMEGAG